MILRFLLVSLGPKDHMSRRTEHSDVSDVCTIKPERRTLYKVHRSKLDPM